MTEPLQGGMDNAALTDAWRKKLPGVNPSDRDLTAFALGVEVGFAHARDLERQNWRRVHYVLTKHGKSPGRDNDHLAELIDRALYLASAVPDLVRSLRVFVERNSSEEFITIKLRTADIAIARDAITKAERRHD